MICIFFYPLLSFMSYPLSSQVKSSKSGYQYTNKKSDKIDSVTLSKSKSVLDIPSSSYSLKDKEGTSHIPILKTRKHKIDSDQALRIEFEHKIKRVSSKHSIEHIHKIDNPEIQHIKNHYQEATTSSSSYLSVGDKKHKSRKDKKSSLSPSSLNIQKEDNKPKDKTKEDYKTSDKPREDTIHKHNKNNLSNLKSDLNFKDKYNKSDKRFKEKDCSGFSFSYSSSLDSLSPSTSTGNLTYPQVNKSYYFKQF